MRDFEELAKEAEAKGMECWLHKVDGNLEYAFWSKKLSNGNMNVFWHYSLALGLNRLIREIKAYPVVR